LGWEGSDKREIKFVLYCRGEKLLKTPRQEIGVRLRGALVCVGTCKEEMLGNIMKKGELSWLPGE
jgi:hypothetical protein